jgi:hypothetical protein
MSQRVKAATPNPRRQFVEKLAERRAREEDLLAAAVDALDARATAQAEIERSDEILRSALADLAAMGFTPDDLANILGTETVEFGGRRRRRSEHPVTASAPASDTPVTADA